MDEFSISESLKVERFTLKHLILLTIRRCKLPFYP